MTDLALAAIAVVAVAGLIVALVWLPTRIVRGLNDPKPRPDDDEEAYWL